MSRKREMSLITITLNKNYKDQFLNTLSQINNVHIKSREKKPIKEKKQKDTIQTNIKNIRQNLDNLFKKLNIDENEFLSIKVKKDNRIRFQTTDLFELISQTSEEINFYLNRINELERYIARAKISLEKIKIIKSGYVFLEQFLLNQESLVGLSQLDFKLFSTFTKNIENLERVFEFSSFPNIHQTDINFPNIYQLEERSIFYVIYPRIMEEKLKELTNIVHAEEIPILKKYLTRDGINFTRINNEINIINQTIHKYEREKKRLRDKNLLKFAAINEVIQNIEEYIWAEKQFEDISPDTTLFKFYVPIGNKDEVESDLINEFRENIIIESLDIPKNHQVFEQEKSRFKGSESIKSEIQTEPKENNKQLQDIEQEDLRADAPTVMKNPFFIRPFELLTKMYGTPSYSEIDPTPFVALTFPLIFGIMFGDIGHGIVLVISGLLGGIIFRKKKSFCYFSWILFYCGIGAIIFGYFLYGEFFGYDNILGFPLPGHNPIENINDVFKLSLIVGVIHISLGWILQFFNYWKQKKKYLALTDSLIKLILIWGGTYLLFNFGLDLDTWFTYPYPILLVLIPGILLVVLKPIGRLFRISYLKKHSFGALMGEGTFETFETALSILSNVASYIRILAFALAHAALMVAVYAMVSLIPQPPPLEEAVNVWDSILIVLWMILIWIGIVFGNLLVIVLEGLLVFINSTRLTFYEFFFKFYSGTGKDFFPFYLDNDYSIIIFTSELEKDIISEEIEKEIEPKKTRDVIDDAIHYIEDKFF